jgi:hypothetical protein
MFQKCDMKYNLKEILKEIFRIKVVIATKSCLYNFLNTENW